MEQIDQEIVNLPPPAKELLIGSILESRIKIYRNPRTTTGWELGPLDFSFNQGEFRKMIDDGLLSRLGEVILWKFKGAA